MDDIQIIMRDQLYKYIHDKQFAKIVYDYILSLHDLIDAYAPGVLDSAHRQIDIHNSPAETRPAKNHD